MPLLRKILGYRSYEDKLRDALDLLLVKYPWLVPIITKLNIRVVDPGDMPFTAGVDEKSIYVAKKTFEKASVEELSAILAHEAFHVLLGHVEYSRRVLYPGTLNIAGDAVIHYLMMPGDVELISNAVKRGILDALPPDAPPELVDAIKNDIGIVTMGVLARMLGTREKKLARMSTLQLYNYILVKIKSRLQREMPPFPPMPGAPMPMPAPPMPAPAPPKTSRMQIPKKGQVEQQEQEGEKCPNCGAPIPDPSASRCPNCGNPIPGQGQQAGQQSQGGQQQEGQEFQGQPAGQAGRQEGVQAGEEQTEGGVAGEERDAKVMEGRCPKCGGRIDPGTGRCSSCGEGSEEKGEHPAEWKVVAEVKAEEEGGVTDKDRLMADNLRKIMGFSSDKRAGTTGSGVASASLEAEWTYRANWEKYLERSILEEFGAKRRRAWVRPNRRSISDLPGSKRLGERKSDVVALVDVSGSVLFDNKALARTAAILAGIAEVKNIKITTVYWDTKVLRVDEDVPSEELFQQLKQGRIQVSGGGGTVIDDALKYVIERYEREARKKKRSLVTVVITDGYVIGDRKLVEEVARKGKMIVVYTLNEPSWMEAPGVELIQALDPPGAE